MMYIIKTLAHIMSDVKHFLYKTTNLLNNKFYYGIHSTQNVNDGYLGSGKLLNIAIKKYGKENFSRKIIEFFNTREEALNKEKEIITEELLLDDNCYNLTWGGLAGEMYYLTLKDTHGNIICTTKDDPRYLSGELIGINGNMTVTKDKDGNKFRVSVDDPRYLSGELVGVCKNTITVKDKDGNKFRVSVDDPRYLSGELVGVAKDCAMKGKIVAKDNSGKKLVISQNDPRYLSGELVGTSKNTQWINNGKTEKMIFENEIEDYLNNGWVLGRKQKHWVHNDQKSKMIFENEIEDYLNNGWVLGRGKIKY